MPCRDVYIYSERATLGISLVSSDNGEILAHCSMLDYPTPSSNVDQAANWKQWTARNFTDNIKASVCHFLYTHTHTHTHKHKHIMCFFFL